MPIEFHSGHQGAMQRGIRAKVAVQDEVKEEEAGEMYHVWIVCRCLQR